MLVDCFPFYNELEMLECRLEYLNDKVDKFVLVEAYTTHMGRPKPMYFEENKERFAKYLDKIIHVKHNITVSKPSYDFDLSKGTDNAAWEADADQRNGILAGIKDLPDDAIIMISDVDEIPNKEAIDRAIRLLNHKLFVFLETKFFLYNLGQHLVELWPATSLCRNDVFTRKRTKPQALRDGKDAGPRVLNGGWHLSYFGDVSRIQNKIKNFTHQEFNNEKFTDPDWIAERIRLGEDPYGRPFPTVKVTADIFPKDFLKVFERYLPNDKKETNMQKNNLPVNCQFGCGTMLANNYLNIDFLDYMFGQQLPPATLFHIYEKGDNCFFLKHDASQGLALLPSDQFENVYHSHFLEHIDSKQGFNFLNECFRIMAPGGRMRILVPDLELWADAYINKKQEFLDWYKNQWLDNSVFYQTNAQIFMGALHNHEHKMGYDFETLKHLLESIGFESVTRGTYGDSTIPSIDFLEAENPRKYESLCLECVKPDQKKRI